MVIVIRDFQIVSDNERLIPVIMKGKPRVVTSGKYKKCKEQLRVLMREQMPEGYKPPEEPVIFMQVQTYKDIGNIAKVVMDALEGAGVIKNDRDILRLDVEKIKAKRGASDSLYIWVIDEDMCP